MDNEGHHDLPARIADAISSVPKAWVPSSAKALDRLGGAIIDIPVAWLAQKKAKIDAQTEAFKLVEGAIAKAAADQVGSNPEVLERAIGVLVRKSYRQQANREAVAVAMLEDLSSHAKDGPDVIETAPTEVIDDDWLNVFERYAEDASSERMQNLWGRVLAGEVRTPGRYSLRTLRFLSEFSQVDALNFAEIANSSFSYVIPKILAVPEEQQDISQLIAMQSAGLLEGVTGTPGLTKRFVCNDEGKAFMIEGDVAIGFDAEPNFMVSVPGIVLTPLAIELLTLLPARDRRAAARTVAHAMRSSSIKAAHLMRVDATNTAHPMEILWDDTAAQNVAIP
ncbi:DUF2806 domain-containing protein [Novosphingobium sp. BL-8A]|uniref:DUF2806 domain-containing protein n=1 Tax=Novosphingobium sp. BL-8A TaxID=3127639 RepID=UPI003757A6C1